MAIAILLIPQFTAAFAQPVSPITHQSVVMGCQNCLMQGVNLIPILKFRLTNTGTNPMGVSEINLHVSGTITKTDLGLVKFYDDPNSTYLDSTIFDFSDRTAKLTGSPIISIPTGEIREITAYVNVKDLAVIGRTAQFYVNEADVLDESGMPILGTLPQKSPWMSVCVPPTFTDPAFIQLMSPNNDEILTRGETYTISWIYRNALGNAWVRNIELIQSGQVIKNIHVISTPRILENGKLCPGQVVRWVVPQDVDPGRYRIRVHLYKGPTDNPIQLDADASDLPFNIE